ncbi:tRNA (adenine(22)-N(1))-methyltransferase TrmK [Enterococcus mundtii]|uniref:tRNA (adenine(22)-N(1))-methyltransferase n=1 Tax=Enterococcus TaxID=1350 RepID=UPI0004519D25|nr:MULTISPECIES: tRNA (adenine(22)-N(1))-methyltransferase TrmK [Enterococcus]AZP92945.1 tRNA (adenine-N(1))-methyltransferase [Enterococcus mundtii]EYT95808.1 SAM-dependent methyltransferase [Enterococcus mundtii CRL35]MDA9428477.1 putative tRNA-m1A22 methylase [Enterococcus mundtii 1A]MDK4210840.1 tRNA (adenine(22)-N(1))-methyltransferase TrmK [Enterococcus mundtii]MEC3940194.1 tRNA (adenine(22)-N(1))-methyltransferase TrmK [Enterococcus mundtii]
MNHTELSKRLETVGRFVPEAARLADIGSDHAYLPVALMLKGKIDFAVAGEVVKGPYESAKRQVMKNGLSERIEVRLANGLDAIEKHDQISAITIAGMGGSLIRDILESGRQNQRLSGEERLILQPNIGEKTLRMWLKENNYQIIAEEIIEENKKIYEIIVAEKKEQPIDYSEKELMFGPFLLEEKNATFSAKWQRELKQREVILEQLKNASEQNRYETIQQEVEWIKEVL